MKSEQKTLFLAAKSAREKSYSPYSKHSVGAAIRTEDGKIFTGCNIENSSYGGTVCAERVAIWKAASEGYRKITEVSVVTDSTPPWPPCGLCRQVIAEFAGESLEQLPIHSSNLEGQTETMAFGELFPKAFTPRHLIR